ncbi:HNH endonuclease [Pseudomonas frederiksbergensis]|nr:HNH endonuclease [Pseudomonas frederiksbergensis]
MDTEKEQTGWTDDELEASVDAYLAIQARYPNDEKFNKSLEHRRLQSSVLPGRNTKSIDFRLQNISALFKELGLNTISTYKPKPHLGSGITARLTKILASKGLVTQGSDTPTADDEVPIRKAKRVKKRDLVSEPEGVLIPQQIVTTTKTYVRISKIKDWILDNAKGICEGCGQPAPFEMDGEPYLEVHHVKHLVQRGTDRPSNTVALCPNCHRRCHHSSDREEFTASLYKKVTRLIPE